MSKAFAMGLVVVAAGAGWARPAMATGLQESLRGGVAVFFMGYGAAPAHAPQGYLGVNVRKVTDDQVPALKLRDGRGAEITLVDHDGPAGKAGLREHDVVLQMNGQNIDDDEQIRRMLRELAPGKTVILTISRDGQPITAKAELANREEVERLAWERHLTVPEPAYAQAPATNEAGGGYAAPPGAPAVRGGSSFMGRMLLLNPSYTGAMLEMLSTQLADFFGVPGSTGLLVRSVVANSPAATAGMRAGDVVVRANSQVMASTNEWTRAMQSSHGRPVTVIVLRDKKETTLTLTPDGKKRSRVEMLPMALHWKALA